MLRHYIIFYTHVFHSFTCTCRYGWTGTQCNHIKALQFICAVDNCCLGNSAESLDFRARACTCIPEMINYWQRCSIKHKTQPQMNVIELRNNFNLINGGNFSSSIWEEEREKEGDRDRDRDRKRELASKNDRQIKLNASMPNKWKWNEYRTAWIFVWGWIFTILIQNIYYIYMFHTFPTTTTIPPSSQVEMHARQCKQKKEKWFHLMWFI